MTGSKQVGRASIATEIRQYNLRDEKHAEKTFLKKNVAKNKKSLTIIGGRRSFKTQQTKAPKCTYFLSTKKFGHQKSQQPQLYESLIDALLTAGVSLLWVHTRLRRIHPDR